jgi:L-ascorbate metabolism protein UlaG (beta-lactamase superfamily)
LTGPGLNADAVGRIDAVLLSHDQHFDNLDTAGRAFLPSASAVLTTRAGARRLGGNAKGLAPWETTTVRGGEGEEIRITATPARHGPPGATLTAGPVIGFCLAWDGQVGGELYLSGDTVLFSGIQQVADRHRVSVAVLSLGAARFAGTGHMRYTFDAEEAARAWQILKAGTVIPNHYEGFTHFKEGRVDAERVLAAKGVPAQWIERGSMATVRI